MLFFKSWPQFSTRFWAQNCNIHAVFHLVIQLLLPPRVQISFTFPAFCLRLSVAWPKVLFWVPRLLSVSHDTALSPEDIGSGELRFTINREKRIQSTTYKIKKMSTIDSNLEWPRFCYSSKFFMSKPLIFVPDKIVKVLICINSCNSNHIKSLKPTRCDIF